MQVRKYAIVLHVTQRSHMMDKEEMIQGAEIIIKGAEIIRLLIPM
jgi:hypothetical protein